MPTLTITELACQYLSSPIGLLFHMLGVDLMTVPQFMQVKISYLGKRSSDLDACIATLQIGQGFNGTCGAAMLVG